MDGVGWEGMGEGCHNKLEKRKQKKSNSIGSCVVVVVVFALLFKFSLKYHIAKLLGFILISGLIFLLLCAHRSRQSSSLHVVKTRGGASLPHTSPHMRTHPHITRTPIIQCTHQKKRMLMLQGHAAAAPAPGSHRPSQPPRPSGGGTSTASSSPPFTAASISSSSGRCSCSCSSLWLITLDKYTFQMTPAMEPTMGRFCVCVVRFFFLLKCVCVCVGSTYEYIYTDNMWINPVHLLKAYGSLVVDVTSRQGLGSIHTHTPTNPPPKKKSFDTHLHSVRV